MLRSPSIALLLVRGTGRSRSNAPIDRWRHDSQVAHFGHCRGPRERRIRDSGRSSNGGERSRSPLTCVDIE